MRTRLVVLILVSIICFGFVRISGSTTTITVKADPAKVPGRIGKNIEFDIYISEIDEESVYDLWAWGLRVSWTDIQFNLISVEEGPFLKQSRSGETTFYQSLDSSEGVETLTLASTIKWSPELGDPRGVLGEGVLVTLGFYVIAGVTGSRFEISDIELTNSAPSGRNRIWPPYIPPGLENPLYDVIVLDEAGEFIRAPKAEDIEPTYGVIDAFDLGVVAANYNLNVTRPRKISTSWTEGAGANWMAPQYLGASDDLKAVSMTDGASTTWTNFLFNTTGWTDVQKVEVGMETWVDAGADNVVIALSNDNGTSFSATTFSHTVDNVKVDEFEWIDVTSAYTWTVADIESIAVNLTYQSVGGQWVRIDYLLVAVTPLPFRAPPSVFDPDADVNYDRVVNIDDLALVGTKYGTYQIEEEE